MINRLLNIIIPESWEIRKLKEISEIIMGQSPPSSTYNTNSDGLPFFQGNADFGYYNPKVRIWCTTPKKIALPSDILVSVRAPVGAINIANEESCIGRGLSAVRVKNEFDMKYIYYFLNHFNKVFSRLKQGSTFEAITKEELINFPVLLPQNLKEQKKIGSVLYHVDELLFKTQNLIKSFQNLKKGLMQRLFTEGIGHTEFKETRLGKIPKTWDLSQIDKKCEKIYAGGTPLRERKEYYENGAILWIKSGEMNNSQIFDTEEKINDLGLKNSSAKIFPSKTVLFALYGATAGRVAFIEKPMTSNQACLGLICKNDELYYLFLFYSFQYKYKSIISQRIGGAQPNLNAEQVKKLKIAIPPLSEQKEIVNILRTVDDRINNENNFNNLLKKNKKGLMQDLLTGKRRVKIN